MRSQGSAGPGPTPYHLRFTNFDERTVAATEREELFASGLHRQPPDEQLATMRAWVAKVSDVYAMPPPQLEVMPPQCAGSGCY